MQLKSMISRKEISLGSKSMKTHTKISGNPIRGQKARNLISKSRNGPKRMTSHKQIMYHKAWTLMWNSHTKMMHPKASDLIRKSNNGPQKHDNHVRKSHTTNVQHKASSRIRVRQKKEAEFIHSQRKKWRQKNPDHTTVTRNEDKLKLHAQPTTLAPSQHIPHQHHPSPFSHGCLCTTSSPPTPNPRLLGNNRVWDKGHKAWNIIRKSHNGQKAWNTIRTSPKNITVGHKPYTKLQWALGLHLIFRLLLHHLSTIFTSHHQHQPQAPRLNPPIAWVHVTSNDSPLYALTYLNSYW